MTVAVFVTGLIVGTLLGLTLAPVLQAWIAWRVIHEAPRAPRRHRVLARLLPPID